VLEHVVWSALCDADDGGLVVAGDASACRIKHFRVASSNGTLPGRRLDQSGFGSRGHRFDVASGKMVDVPTKARLRFDPTSVDGDSDDDVKSAEAAARGAPEPPEAATPPGDGRRAAATPLEPRALAWAFSWELAFSVTAPLSDLRESGGGGGSATEEGFAASVGTRLSEPSFVAEVAADLEAVGIAPTDGGGFAVEGGSVVAIVSTPSPTSLPTRRPVPRPTPSPLPRPTPRPSNPTHVPTHRPSPRPFVEPSPWPTRTPIPTYGPYRSPPLDLPLIWVLLSIFVSTCCFSIYQFARDQERAEQEAVELHAPGLFERLTPAEVTLLESVFLSARVPPDNFRSYFCGADRSAGATARA